MNLKKPLIIGGILSVVGIGMMVTTYQDANFNLTYQKGRGLETVDVRQNQQSFDAKDVKKLDVDVKNSEVQVRQGDSDKWKVETVAYSGVQSSVNVTDGTLKVTAPTDKPKLIMSTGSTSGHFDDSYNSDLNNADTVIIVPKDVNIENVQIDGRDGGIILERINAKHTNINLADGGARLEHVNGDTLNYRGQDGRMHLENVNLKSMDVTGDNLRVSGTNLKLQEASQVKMTDGKFWMDRVQAPGFDLQADGNVHFNAKYDEDTDEFDNEKGTRQEKHGNQDKALKVEAGSGKIGVNEHKGLPNDYDGDYYVGYEEYDDEDDDDEN
ncbi:DUF4097 family beta strand repeat protein [Weissella minor]|uniref:DUF4097 family beta strand repeat-containing protein n=1 Tax=Weissella minor TaxID=1620 RepID=UPI001BAE6BE3|nr:DUF4097 family beta strand repeat-containing protein [Weissella minor]MBS0949809.1 DUF4097 family beta strand repeat protein [Weissella minor]